MSLLQLLLRLTSNRGSVKGRLVSAERSFLRHAILRLVDTCVGIIVGLLASRVGILLGQEGE